MELERYLSNCRNQTKIIVSRTPCVDYYLIILMNLFLKTSLSEGHHSSLMDC